MELRFAENITVAWPVSFEKNLCLEGFARHGWRKDFACPRAPPDFSCFPDEVQDALFRLLRGKPCQDTQRLQ